MEMQIDVEMYDPLPPPADVHGGGGFPDLRGCGDGLLLVLDHDVRQFVYLLLSVRGHHILEFNLETSSLAVINADWPQSNFATYCCVMRGEDGNVGLAVPSFRGFQMWEMKSSVGGDAKWVLRKTVNLHHILGLSSVVQWQRIDINIMGYSEDLINAFVLVVDTSFFMVQADSQCGPRNSLIAIPSPGVIPTQISILQQWKALKQTSDNSKLDWIAVKLRTRSLVSRALNP
uniref:Uncharacterized protein n=1 Tax=Oryza brachyantha TaxID=4533 RepID=J3N0S8_ORYBR